jgi:hypothetical protein
MTQITAPAKFNEKKFNEVSAAWEKAKTLKTGSHFHKYRTKKGYEFYAEVVFQVKWAGMDLESAIKVVTEEAKCN